MNDYEKDFGKVDPKKPINPNSYVTQVKADSDVTLDGGTRIDNASNLGASSEVEKATAINIASYNEMMKKKALEQNNVQQQVVETEKPLSKGKVFGGIFLFLIMILFVVFLPQIQDYIDALINSKQIEQITEGQMVCKLDSTTDNFNINYEQIFDFSNSLPTVFKYNKLIRGSAANVKDLEEEKVKCKNLVSQIDGLSGVSVICDLDGYEFRENQKFIYKELDVDKLDAAYSEAGGFYPKYDMNKNINKLKEEIQSSGYVCTISK